MKNDSFERKLKILCYYFKQFNENRFDIYMIENPGWGITIDCKYTVMEDKLFESFLFGIDDEDNVLDVENWWSGYVEDNIFMGACAPELLRPLINLFCDWAEKCGLDFDLYGEFTDDTEYCWCGFRKIVKPRIILNPQNFYK